MTRSSCCTARDALGSAGVPLKSSLRHLAKNVVGPQILPRLERRTDLAHSTFGLSVGSNGRLHLGEHDLVELSERFGSPLHVVDGDRLSGAADEALAPFRDPGRPGCDVYYSYKTNPVPGVLSRLHSRGIGAEVISEYELWLAFELGVPAERIIYNGPAKSPASIERAVRERLLAINANSRADAERIVAVARRLDTPVNMGLRVALAGGWGGQFGLAPDLDRVVQMVEEFGSDPLVDLMCLHVHRGGSIRSVGAVEEHVGGVVSFLSQLHERTGWSPRLVDFGGSLASPTVSGFDPKQFRLNRLLGADLLPPDPSTAATIAEASTIAGRALDEWARAAGVETPAGALEPGRGLTSDTQLLLTTVLDVKSDVEPTHAIVDAGINVAEAAANEYHQLYSASAPAAEAEQQVRLAGPICTPADVLYNNWRLPELESGHVLAIMDSGAYFVPFSTSFSFPRPAIVMCDGDEVNVIRAGEQFDDLIRLDQPQTPA